MKAMILAAGEGRRMRPLTNTVPKPLLQVAGRPLLEHQILNLKAAGFNEIVINASYLGTQIVDFCGDGRRWGVQITISREEVPLETAGGIVSALKWLGSEPFLVVNGDVFTNYPFQELLNKDISKTTAHLVLVDNPQHHPRGDFVLDDLTSRVKSGSAGAMSGPATLTFSGIALYHPTFFVGLAPGRRLMRPLFDQAIGEGRLSGEHFRGEWIDVGSLERLEQIRIRLAIN